MSMQYQPPPGQSPQQYYPPPHGQPQQQQYGHQQQQQPLQQQAIVQHQPQQQQQQQHVQQPQAIKPVGASDSGQFHGGYYHVTHRDTNAILVLDLQPQAIIRSIPGAMVHMSGTVSLVGKVKFSMRKLLTGGELSESSYTGPGRVALGPTLFGDIITLQLDGRTNWVIGRDAFLACTPDVTREMKAQGLGKALFSGEDLFVSRLMGQGFVWLTSFGAVDRLDIQAGETHIVDNGHLVAWNCDYKIERAGSGTLASLKTGEGLVCRFTGPGSVYIQTRNMEAFQTFIRTQVGGSR